MINLNKCKKTGVILVFLGVLLNPLVAQIEHEGDWFSASTVSSVVKLGSVLQIYEVEGLPDNYTYRTKGGEPDFGNAKVISSRTVFENYGSGVIISESGLIISNAHVARAYIRPTIETLSDSKSVKLVIVNPMPYLMFVGVSDKERVENGDDAQKLKYAAYVIDADENFDNNKRDRSVLQIVYSARLGNDGLPKIGEKLSNLKIPCAILGNPFRTSFVDKKVRAIGFPGIGDPNRSARTSGELLGYQDENCSVILHTSYIAGGNSGGGLFHKDNLIGINTWDITKNQNPGRPVAGAQPITYWFDMLSKAAWIYQDAIELPDGLLLDWIADDPSTEAYKDEVQVMLSFVSESNKNVPVTSGRLYAHRVDTDIADVFEYLAVADELDIAAEIIYYLKYFTVDDFVKKYDEDLKRLGINRAYVEQFQSITNVSQLRDMLKPQHKAYFDEWQADTFYCKSVRLDDEDGRTTISVPKNSRLHLTYITDDGKTSTTFTLTAGDKYFQGPFTLSVKQ